MQNFFESKKEYLRAQVGNPEGPDKPNKKVINAWILQRVADISCNNSTMILVCGYARVKRLS